MSLLTNTRSVLPIVLHRVPKAEIAPRPVTVPSAHLAMIKRFATFALAFAGLAAVVAAVVTIKLSIFYPRFFH